jgi:hypothetical protein
MFLYILIVFILHKKPYSNNKNYVTLLLRIQNSNLIIIPIYIFIFNLIFLKLIKTYIETVQFHYIYIFTLVFFFSIQSVLFEFKHCKMTSLLVYSIVRIVKIKYNSFFFVF